MARGLKFWILKAEGLYFPSGENKGADQLLGYRDADLRLCFGICKNPVFSRRGSYVGMEACDLDHLYKHCYPLPKETPHEIAILERKIFENGGHIHVYRNDPKFSDR